MHDPFLQIDLPAAQERLQLDARGEAQGRLNLPAPESHTLDQVEAGVVAEIAEHYSHAQIEGINQMRAYGERVTDLALLAELSSIGGHAKTALGDFQVEVANCRNRLTTSRQDIVDSFRELQAFRQANSLSRPAHDVPSGIVTGGSMATAWLFEAGANTLLLRLNDDLGILGGFIAAATVAGVNVLLAAIVGRQVWPRIHLRQSAARFLAWSGIALWVVLLLIWNLAAAHYRDAKSAGLSVPETAALRLMASQPLGLDSLYSWGLFVVGIVCAIIAALAAFRMDDPFPGYGAVSRRHRERCELYAGEVEATTKRLQEIRNAAIAEAQDVRAQLGQQFRERERIMNASDGLRRRYDQHGAQLEQTANALLETYRAANRKARTEPVPDHFNRRWSMPRRPLEELNVAAIDKTALDACDTALERAIDEIAGAFSEASARFESLESLQQRLSDEAA